MTETVSRHDDRDFTKHQDNANSLQELPLNWRAILAVGIFMVLAGSLGIGLSVYLTLGSMLLFAALMATGGIMQLAQGIQSGDKHWLGRTQHFGIALLYLLTAGLIVWDPLLATSGMTLALAALFIAMGIIKIRYAMRCKKRQWKWLWPVISGLMSLSLATLVLVTWPQSSLWLLGMLVAVELLVNGWFLTLLALRIKKANG